MVLLGCAALALCSDEVCNGAARCVGSVLQCLAPHGLCSVGICCTAVFDGEDVLLCRTVCGLCVARNGVDDGCTGLERELVVLGRAVRAVDGLAAEYVAACVAVDVDGRVLPLVCRQVEAAACGCLLVVVRDKAVLNVARALTARAGVAGEGEFLARCHLEEVDVLFHDAAKPVGNVCARRLFDGTVGKSGVIVQREDGIPIGKIRAKAPCDLAEVFEAADVSALALEVEDVALGRLVAADEFACDGDVSIIRAVADGDLVARGRAVAAREAAVDIARDTSAVEVNVVLCGCTAR